MSLMVASLYDPSQQVANFPVQNFQDCRNQEDGAPAIPAGRAPNFLDNPDVELAFASTTMGRKCRTEHEFDNVLDILPQGLLDELNGNFDYMEEPVPWTSANEMHGLLDTQVPSQRLPHPPPSFSQTPYAHIHDPPNVALDTKPAEAHHAKYGMSSGTDQIGRAQTPSEPSDKYADGSVSTESSWHYTEDRQFRTQFRKTQWCRYFNKTGCTRGAECDFAHSLEELESLPDFRKTSLCKLWEQGRCPHATKDCQFAHGKLDLRVTRPFQKPNREYQGREGDSAGDAQLQMGQRAGAHRDQRNVAHQRTAPCQAQAVRDRGQRWQGGVNPTSQGRSARNGEGQFGSIN